MTELYIIYAIYATGKEIIAAHTQAAIINQIFKATDRGRPIELVKLTYNEETGEAAEESLQYNEGGITWYWQ